MRLTYLEISNTFFVVIFVFVFVNYYNKVTPGKILLYTTVVCDCLTGLKSRTPYGADCAIKVNAYYAYMYTQVHYITCRVGDLHIITGLIFIELCNARIHGISGKVPATRSAYMYLSE